MLKTSETIANISVVSLPTDYELETSLDKRKTTQLKSIESIDFSCLIERPPIGAVTSTIHNLEKGGGEKVRLNNLIMKRRKRYGKVEKEDHQKTVHQ